MRRELVAVIVAIGGAGSLLALAIGAAWEIASPTGHLSAEASTVLSTALGAGIGAIAAYLGGQSRDRDL